MGVVVGVDNLSNRNIIVSQDEILASGIEVIAFVVQCIDSLFVIFECSEMILFFGVHNFDVSWLEANCHHCGIGSDAEGRYIFGEIGDFSEDFMLVWVIEGDSECVWVDYKIWVIIVRGYGSDGGGECGKLFGLILFPESLLTGLFFLALGWFEGL